MKKIFLLLLSAFLINFSYSQSWVFMTQLPTPQFNINSISVVDANTIWVCGTVHSVYKSTNGGFNWTAANTGLPSTDMYGISAVDANNCWVGTLTGSIYNTTNGGTSWTLQVAVTNSFINGIKMFNSNFGVYFGDPAGTGQPYQLRRTTNGGVNWIVSPTAPIATSEFGVVNAWDWLDSATFWLGSANTIANATTAKIYRTTGGFFGSWNNTPVAGVGGSAGLYYQAIAFINATSGMSGSNGSSVVKTTDGGATWTPASNPPALTTYAAINMHGFKDNSNLIRMITSDGAGVYQMWRTTNLGTSWTQETLPSQGSTNGIQHMQFLNQSLGFAGGGQAVGGSACFYRFGPPLGVDPGNTNLPQNYSLEQNYPNPFNPSTTIKYSLPKSSFVTLKIFDAIGNVVKTLVNGNQATGNYTETVDMSSMATGIYFYTLTAGDFKETRKMTLIK